MSDKQTKKPIPFLKNITFIFRILVLADLFKHSLKSMYLATIKTVGQGKSVYMSQSNLIKQTREDFNKAKPDSKKLTKKNLQKAIKSLPNSHAVAPTKKERRKIILSSTLQILVATVSITMGVFVVKNSTSFAITISVSIFITAMIFVLIFMSFIIIKTSQAKG